jgi:hypothetical protein
MAQEWLRMLSNDLIAEGCSLQEQHQNETAFPISVAVRVLTILRGRITVLGGDFYRLTEGRFQPTYRNWYISTADLGDDPLGERSVDRALEEVSKRCSTGLYVVLVCK